MMELANKGVVIDGRPQSSHNTAVAEIDAAGKSSFAITEDVAWDHLRMHASVDAVAEQADNVCFGKLAQRSPGSRATIQEVKVSDDEWPTVARLLDLPGDPLHGADRLLQRHDLDLVALTSGADGSVLFTRTRHHAQPADERAPSAEVGPVG